MRVCGPKTLIPKHIASMGVEVSHDLDETLAWCDVANMLRIQQERPREPRRFSYSPRFESMHLLSD